MKVAGDGQRILKKFKDQLRQPFRRKNHMQSSLKIRLLERCFPRCRPCMS